MLKRRFHDGFRAARAFTLIELLTVIVVIAILATMITGVVIDMRSRAERVQCVQNLKNLYTAGANYVSQQGSWPQIDPTMGGDDRTTYAKAWVAAFEPMGLTQTNWICPTVQRVLNDPSLINESYRIDYMATPFDDKPMTPYLWPHQPWFIERGSVHGTGGNLLIWSNGQVVTLEEALQYN